MLSTILPVSLAVLSLISPALAQTWTYCNPTNKTCPADEALGMSNTFNFTTQTKTDATIWNATSGVVTYDGESALFTINKRFDSPTIQSNFYIFFGTIEVIMKAAAGQGIISSIVLESDDLDEIDWEIMGGNTTSAETNYFGKGNTTSYDRAIYYDVDNPEENYHNYTVVWSAEKIEWLIDSKIVRTLMYDDALGGKNFPQTPMTVRLGIWAGGDSSEPNGTIEWAGGATDYSKAPFTMRVASVRVEDASKGASYTYSDFTGDWQSIKVAPGNSTIQNYLTAPPPQTPVQKFQGMSKGVQIAIIASAAGGALALLSLCICCCCRQRKAGKHEKEIADYEFAKQQEDMEAYKNGMGMSAKGPGYIQVDSVGSRNGVTGF